MQIIFISLMLLLSFSDQVFANDCRAVKWPYARDVSKIQPKDFLSISRDSLYKYLYYELSISKEARVPGLAAKLFFNLKNSEPNMDKIQMLEGFEWAADLETSTPRVISLEEICSIEAKINRAPTSIKKEVGSSKK